MDTMLLVVTVASLVVAAGSATVAWRVTRAERHRQAARVAALAAAAGVTQLPARTAEVAPGPALETAAGITRWPAGPAPVPQSLPAAMITMEASQGLDDFLPAPHKTPAFATGATGAVAATDGTGAAASGGLFAAPVVITGSAGRQQWLMGAAGVFAAVVVTFASIGFLGSRVVGTVTAPQIVPLELVALSHNRAEGALAVAGLVRNPDGGAPVKELEAEVRVFDAAGILIATRSALVALVEPGQDASFTVSLGEIATAARYRVSFHAGGAIVPHVDRRTNLPSAVTAEAR